MANRLIARSRSAWLVVASGLSKLAATPSCRETETAPIRGRDGRPDGALPGADTRTHASNRPAVPDRRLDDARYRSFFLRRASARANDRGCIEIPKRF